MNFMTVRKNSRTLPPLDAGFTLVELMVVLAVAAILMVLAAPSFVGLLADNRSTMETQDVINDLQLARSEAIRRGLPITMRAESGNADFGNSGWTTFTDKNADGEKANPETQEDGTVLRKTEAVVGGTTIMRMQYTDDVFKPDDSPNRGYITFNERGGAETKKTTYFKVCVSSSSNRRSGRIIEISAAGAITQNKNNTWCTDSP